MDDRMLARSLAWGRIAIGTALLVAPRQVARLLVGSAGAAREFTAISRAAGVRDIALGAGLLAALEDGTARRWLRWSALCDLVAGLAAARAGENSPWTTRRLVPVAAIGSAVVGAHLGERID